MNHNKNALLSLEKALELSNLNPNLLCDYFEGMHDVGIATLLVSCRDDKDRLRLLFRVPNSKRGDVVLKLPDQMQESLLAIFKPYEIESMIAPMNSDDAADILQGLDSHTAAIVFALLEPEEQREIRPLLHHHEESAGGLMQSELFKVRSDWSVSKVLLVLRRWGREINNLNYVYVVDDQDHFVGSTPLHKLLFADPKQGIFELTDIDSPFALAGQDQEEVASIFALYDILVLPVLDDNHVLVGRITADDILDVMQDEATEDMYRLAGVSDEDDLSESVVQTARLRSVWLAVNLMTAILASFVISQFEATLNQIVALAILMPIVASMGGIAGTQTLTVIVRNIALGRVHYENARSALLKEMRVGLLTGSLFAVLIGGIVMFWFPDLGFSLGLIIAIAMFINLIAAATAGAIIPLTLQRLNIDPALASGTILTTVTDIVGFIAFLGLATWFLL
ncbi:MAG: magnesium transporter [Mariprofundaceae bacterium]|nr:magnesium transporter [Mariprofundaceae bacterium]